MKMCHQNYKELIFFLENDYSMYSSLNALLRDWAAHFHLDWPYK